MTGDVVVETVGHVAVIALNRPPANYFDLSLIIQLVDAAQRAQEDGRRAIVLCSEGKHFCAGANFGSADTGDARVTSTAQLYHKAIELFELEIPVIAAVQGAAVGGGLGLACAADFRVASPASRFHANFSLLGFHQGFGLSASLPRIVGSQRAAKMLYSSERVDGEHAASMGLADRLVETGTERDAALSWASELAVAAPLAVRSIKSTLRSPVIHEVREAVERELVEQARLWSTEDSEIGIAASLARTTPTFFGR
ncbi:enoyl-CoA hydratase/isomerase family protein [soil metagenome]